MSLSSAAVAVVVVRRRGRRLAGVGGDRDAAAAICCFAGVRLANRAGEQAGMTEALPRAEVEATAAAAGPRAERRLIVLLERFSDEKGSGAEEKK